MDYLDCLSLPNFLYAASDISTTLIYMFYSFCLYATTGVVCLNAGFDRIQIFKFSPLLLARSAQHDLFGFREVLAFRSYRAI